MSKVIYQTLEPRNAVYLLSEFSKMVVSSNKKKTLKRFRYVESMDSIFKHIQIGMNPQSESSPILMAHGRIEVDTYIKPNLIKFLDESIQNEANGGTLFRKIDLENQEDLKIELAKSILEAKNIVLNNDSYALNRFIAINSIGNKYISKNFGDSHIKNVLLQRIDSIPNFHKTVIEYATQRDNIDAQLVVSTALSENIINMKDGMTITWSGSSDPLFVCKTTSNVIEEFALWLTQDKELGMKTLTIISNKLKEV